MNAKLQATATTVTTPAVNSAPAALSAAPLPPDPGGHAAALPLAALDALDQALERAILRLRARYQLSLDELRGLYVSDEQVDALLRPAGVPEPWPAGIDVGALAWPGSNDDPSPWQQMCRWLQLTPAEAAVLLLVLAPELDPKYGPLLAYLNDDAARRWATPELAARVLAAVPGTPAERLALRTAASPPGRLFGWGLIEWLPGSQGSATQAQRGLRVAPALAPWLLGLPYADERLASAEWLRPEGLAPLPLAEPTARRIDALAHSLAAGQRWPPVRLHGGDAAELLAAAHELFRRARRSALRVPAAALRRADAATDLAPALRLAQQLFGCGLVLVPAAAAGDAEWPAPAFVLPGCVIVDPERRCAALATDDVLDLAVPPLPLAARSLAWQAALAPLRPHPAGATLQAPAGAPLQLPPTIDTEQLADRYALGPARIARAVALACRGAALDGSTPDALRLADAARTICAAAATTLTRPLQTAFEWRDLVLPPPVHERLTDIVRAVEQRARVLDQWGFGRSLGVARGLKLMFAGASGTGKSMAAALIAKTLALDLHRIELAGVVSKYIGETEKNLDRAFDAARDAGAILFIDEADALFGKRSEVKDAHDRYANVETAYLLQKMEDHDGVVILATNLAQHIDTAFSRRMHCVVEFPRPDVACRERLWRRMFPPEAPRADDIDFGFLARQFDFAGGDIRNIVLDAGYAAARAGTPIGMAQLLRAVARQYAKRGKVAGAAEFREYRGLLDGATDAPPG